MIWSEVFEFGKVKYNCGEVRIILPHEFNDIHQRT